MTRHARAPLAFAALSALALLGGCGGQGGGSNGVASAAPASVDDDDDRPIDLDAFAKDPLASDVHGLAERLGLDRISEERILSMARATWDSLSAEIRKRAEAADRPLEEEDVAALIEERQRALDDAIAATLTPDQKRAFEAFGGRIALAGP